LVSVGTMWQSIFVVDETFHLPIFKDDTKLRTPSSRALCSICKENICGFSAAFMAEETPRFICKKIVGCMS